MKNSFSNASLSKVQISGDKSPVYNFNRIASVQRLFVIGLFFFVATLSGCGLYSFSGASTAAKNITIEQFFNNTDLAPANVSQTFTNKLKDYYQRNSSLKVVPENGELQVDGAIT
ncbi:MAG: hypothetical protein JJE09_16185 [Bacteroidia bacterium]|nr:hypothetical protein [Bacteroidia bacterium]